MTTQIVVSSVQRDIRLSPWTNRMWRQVVVSFIIPRPSDLCWEFCPHLIQTAPYRLFWKRLSTLMTHLLRCHADNLTAVSWCPDVDKPNKVTVLIWHRRKSVYIETQCIMLTHIENCTERCATKLEHSQARWVIESSSSRRSLLCNGFRNWSSTLIRGVSYKRCRTWSVFTLPGRRDHVYEQRHLAGGIWVDGAVNTCICMYAHQITSILSHLNVF